jgi:hypothetical protein
MGFRFAYFFWGAYLEAICGDAVVFKGVPSAIQA